MTGDVDDAGSAFSCDPAEEQYQPPEPKPRERIAPKVGLEAMTYFLMDIVLSGTMRDGEFADEHCHLFTAADLEKLQDIADTLDFFRIQRLHSGIEKQRRGSR